MNLDVARIGWDIAKVCGGAVVAGIGAYLVFGKEVAYIKGQLAQIMTLLKLSEKNRERIVVLEKRQDKSECDINRAHSKIREIAP